MRNVLILGDSLAQGLELIQSKSHVESYPGATAKQLAEIDLKTILDEDAYDIIVLFAGTNDLGQGSTLSECLHSIMNLVRMVRTFTAIPVLVMELSDQEDFNWILMGKMSNRTKVHYCPGLDMLEDDKFDADGFHLNAAGKQKCAEWIEESIEDDFPSS